MKKLKSAAMLSIAAVALAGPSPVFAAKKPKPPLTVEEAEFKVTLKDDSLESIATFDTSMVQKTGGLFSSQEGDGLIRASVDKKTGITSFQVYTVINYRQSWRFYVLGNYETPAGPVQTELTKIAAEVLSCRYGCEFAEAVGFNVDEATLRALADQPVGALWRYRLKSKAGIDTDMTLEAAEIGGLLSAVDKYRVEHKLPSPQPPTRSDGA